ncbi:hypothetical protein P691DRAFT_157221 [Macrolepiota fuliginosa MF-IS2]|uniref:Uncharacterized protein n=1 Tax=Macrolepiota fuliginosa MF-IS2 TaxID=1400762 RepID=A0A9P5X8N9_9AGAR|nr:hypothetical protein P691DRAFT_157221 [Macrolepiota fuliginosa MF-IS2]
MITITTPEAMEESEYCLKVQDDFGNVFTLPVFDLGAGARSVKLTASSVMEVLTAVAKETGTPVTIVEATNHSPLPRSTSTGEVAQNNSTVVPRIDLPTPPVQRDVLVSQRPFLIAPFTVPPSVVSRIAGLLCVRTRRKMAQERKRELKTLILSHRDSGQAEPTPSQGIDVTPSKARMCWNILLSTSILVLQQFDYRTIVPAL